MYCVYGNSGRYIHGGPLFGGGPLLGGSVIGGFTVYAKAPEIARKRPDPLPLVGGVWVRD